MFNKDKKYTMEEFKELFDNAKVEALKKDAEKNEGLDDPMAKMIMGMSTMSTIMLLEQELFKDMEEE